jgi:hypothetical protein
MISDAAELSLASSKSMDYGVTEYQIRLEGEIKDGDSRKIEGFLREKKIDQGSFYADRAVISLSSVGGSYIEGLKLAHLFQEKGVQTLVKGGDTCASACAIAFLGGTLVGEEEVSMTARTLEIGGILAFHAPYLNLSEGHFDKAMVETAWDAAVLTIANLIEESAKLRLNTSLLPIILKEGRDSALVLKTVSDLGRFRVSTHTETRPRKFTPTMAFNLCWNGSSNYGTSDYESNLAQFRKTRPVSFNINTGYYGPQLRSVLRTVMQTDEGGEGSPIYCVVDTLEMEGHLRASCRGTFNAGSISEARKIAERLDQNGNYTLEEPCDTSLGLDVLKGYERSMSETDWVAVVPPNTPISLIGKALEFYEKTEQPITTNSPSRSSK